MRSSTHIDDTMDPVSVVGLAGAAVQFVTFAAQLISKTKEIQSSVTGLDKKSATLEAVYRRLEELSLGLATFSGPNARPRIVASTADDQRLVKAMESINGLSRIRNEDRKKLIEAVRRLTGGHGSKGRWRGFRIALKSVWKEHEIVAFEDRLHSTQTTLTLQVCTLTR